MNKSNLKRYAPQARRDFIAAVTARANLLGLSIEGGELHAAPAETRNDIVLIAGRAWPVKVQGQRQRLIQRMRRLGVAQVIDAVAYAWFNRLAALRYMELHDYLGHGRRVLSNPAGGLPEVLAHALELAEQGDLPGLNVDSVRELKIGNRDAEHYRQILIAQCNALHRAMPFLFEAIDDETELLLPDNLLHSDSIVARLVAEIPDEDWAEVEAIGWLYQFYISEKKDQVIGKVVKSEDIPAATQLFTPNWIVQYLVQNSVGRLWLMANPGSTLASQWPYYIQPAEQTPEVQAQLDALIQTRIREDGEALEPESITVLDPACGSGHILVVAYDVLKAIYLERGYQPRAIPRLILEKNLFGLDIDDRAAQLAGFALLMKARADDRRLFNDPPKLNVLSLQESKGLDVDELARSLAPFGLQHALLKALLETFEHAKTFGSLIQIPAGLNGSLTAMSAGSLQASQNGDLYARQAATDVLPMLSQALVLGMQFDAVVANPPYMGLRGMNGALKEFARSEFPKNESDLFSIFIRRGFAACKPTGLHGMVTMQSWMFLPSYLETRKDLLWNRTLLSAVHMDNGVMGIAFGTVATSVFNGLIGSYRGSFSYCSMRDIDDNGAPGQFPVSNSRRSTATAKELRMVPGYPIAYWVGPNTREAFNLSPATDYVTPKQGLATGDNERYLRYWWEVDRQRSSFDCGSRQEALATGRTWFPYSKGGESKKWYGSNEYVVYFPNDGEEIRNLKDKNGNEKSRFRAASYYFMPAITWSLTSSSTGDFSARYRPAGYIFDINGMSAFGTGITKVLALLNSRVGNHFLELINPTMAFQIGDIGRVPILPVELGAEISKNVQLCISHATSNWDSLEVSWDFSCLEVLRQWASDTTIGQSWEKWRSQNLIQIQQTALAEAENNRYFIKAYGLQSEVSSEVTEEQITLVRADREKDCQRLISYAIGCMMGRYSLDAPGLIYAHAGNVGFDPSRYDKKFPADADGIVPVTDEPWFADDAASRVREFLRAVWGAETLDENMAWLAESLGAKGGEAPDDSIRRYLADKFFKDHLQTYKKRPIYWLFSSGKQGAFQALVYLHRYHPGTLARMRAEYVVPLTGKLQARIESVEKDIQSATSTAARTKLGKRRDTLRKQHLELLAYDEQLRHYADQRITLDLDDGVKVNYGKFGPLLAEVKAVTGGAGDDD